MRLLLAGASAAALTALSTGALAQQAAPGAGQGDADAVERSADQATCLDISRMDVALVPGVLYFVAGHREGASGEGASPAMEDPDGELPGMEDATVAQEGASADDEPGPAVAGTEDDPTADDEEIAEDGEDAAEDAAGTDAAEVEADAPQAAEASDPDAADQDQPVRVRGHFEIPIERTVLACAEDPDALLAEVIEQQRQEATAGQAVPDDDG
jgi:hypothetical protein